VTVTRPRLIGMVGGMSWESSAEYYRQANELVAAKLGGLHSARLILVSVDFAEVEQLQVTGQWDEAGQLLADIAKRLEAAGAELLVLCTNTMHKVADQVQAAVSIPLLHLADAIAAAVIDAGIGTGRATWYRVHHGAGLLSRAACEPRSARPGARRG
jgi:aspartate racemase